jgi:opacity protein-like surface antigen
MRNRFMAMAAVATVSALTFGALPAHAADYPVLRGTSSPSLPPPPQLQADPSPWEGFYLGGLAGYNAVAFDPGNSAARMVRNGPLFRNTFYETQGASNILQIPAYSARGTMFGGFAGYNMQVDEVVVGFEVDYNRIGRNGSANGVDIGRRFINTDQSQRANVTLSGASSTRLEDLVTLRARAGYVMGNLMPYVTGGLAIGYGRTSTTTRADVSLQDSVGGSGTGVWGPEVIAIGSPETLVNARKNAFMAGVTAGAGMEAMFGGLILRGEYLFTRLATQGGVAIDVNQGRVGAGVKF